MIPEFNDDSLLPPGIHRATLEEFKERFVIFNRSDRRLRVFEGLDRLLNEVRRTRIATRVIIAGSFVTAKAEPNDFDCTLVVESSVVDRQLSPFEYQLISHRMARRVFKGDVFVAEDGSEALNRLLKLSRPRVRLNRWALWRSSYDQRRKTTGGHAPADDAPPSRAR